MSTQMFSLCFCLFACALLAGAVILDWLISREEYTFSCRATVWTLPITIVGVWQYVTL